MMKSRRGPELVEGPDIASSILIDLSIECFHYV